MFCCARITRIAITRDHRRWRLGGGGIEAFGNVRTIDSARRNSARAKKNERDYGTSEKTITQRHVDEPRRLLPS